MPDKREPTLAHSHVDGDASVARWGDDGTDRCTTGPIFFRALHVNLQCSKMSDEDAKKAIKQIAELIASLASHVAKDNLMPEDEVQKLIALFQKP